MALPGNVGNSTVTGLIEDSDGTLGTGTVTFTPALPKWADTTSSPQAIIVPKARTATLASGAFSISLISTDDTDLTPTNWTYTVHMDVHFGTTAASLADFSISVPAGTWDLASLMPVTTSQGTFNGGGSGDPSQYTHAATSKTTPDTADEIPFANSADSWKLGKYTYGNLRAAIAAYIGAIPDDLSDLAGTISYAQMAPDSCFSVRWTGTQWEKQSAPGVAVTTRPTSRTDLTMIAKGGTAAPSFAITGDLWLEDNS